MRNRAASPRNPCHALHATAVRLSVAIIIASLGVPAALAQSWANPQQALQWRSVQSPFTPGPGAVAGGPGDDPQPNSPLFICRASVQGSVTPGKWVNGNCNVAYGGREYVMRVYEVAYGHASWRAFGNRNDQGLIQTGNEADGMPLYSCRVRYSTFGKDLGYQPGKIVDDRKCDIAYGGREVVVRPPFEALYAGNMGAPATAGSTYPWHGQHHGTPLCKSGDPGVLLHGRTWSGPNCIPVDVMTNQPVPVAQPRPGEPRPLCRKGDPGVTFTAVGYAGPNCVTTNTYGEVAAYGNATPEEKAHYRETMEPCKPGDASVHVENGMLVGADCKSVPEPVTQSKKPDDCSQSNFGIRNGNQIKSGNSCINNDQQQKAEADEKAAEAKAVAAGRAASEADLKAAQDAEAKAQADKAAEEKAAADQRAAGEAEELRMAKEAEAHAQADKAAQEKAAQEQRAAAQKAAEEKAAADQRAAGEAEELRMAKEAEAKAEADKAAQEKAAAEQQAAEQKAAAEKAAAEQRAAAEAEELKVAKEAEAKAEQEKAAKEQSDREKLEQLKKAFEEQAAKNASSAPASSGNPR